jgi:hypothetical protein
VLITFLLFISCQKNCDEEIKNLTEQYQKALFNTGGSSTAVIKLTDDYNKKLAELNKRCN